MRYPPVARSTTGPDGRYFVSLKPGTYSVVASVGDRPIPVTVTVRAGKVTNVPPDVDGRVTLSARDQTRLYGFGQRVARRLALAPTTAEASVNGTTASGARRLFGAAAPVGDAHVWVYMLVGRPTSKSPPGSESRALQAGGYVAWELDAGTLRVVARRVSAQPWRPWPKWTEANLLWGPGIGFMVR